MARNKTSKTGSDPCDNSDTATPALNEWGIPDWRDKAAYGDVGAWSLGRWRWEFFRRRDDVRALFDERKDKQYESSLANWERDCTSIGLTPDEQTFILENAPVKPNEPRFRVFCLPKEAKAFGYFAIPNPRIGNISDFDNHVEQLDSYEWAVSGERGGTMLQGRKLEKHHLVIAFSTDRPLAQQIKDAGEYLKGLQKYRHGKHFQKRRHTLKWRGYLRTLDAREAGASWAEISTLHPDTVQSEQTARDIWQAANALRFNF